MTITSGSPSSRPRSVAVQPGITHQTPWPKLASPARPASPWASFGRACPPRAAPRHTRRWPPPVGRAHCSPTAPSLAAVPAHLGAHGPALLRRSRPAPLLLLLAARAGSPPLLSAAAVAAPPAAIPTAPSRAARASLPSSAPVATPPAPLRPRCGQPRSGPRAPACLWPRSPLSGHVLCRPGRRRPGARAPSSPRRVGAHPRPITPFAR
nr:translation initiation factor IF-2-like [Aegilops tauschii subsp. strangulata]